jgi:glycosyltransferase involved in cell wall biosynthesis
MRVAMIGSRGIGSNYGGIEKVLDEVCPRLVTRGIEVDVYSRRDVPEPGHPDLRVMRIPGLRHPHFETLSRAALSTIYALPRRYDILHFHGLASGAFAPLGRLARRPVVVTVHGLDWKRAKWGRAARWSLAVAEQIALRSASLVTVVSRTLQEDIRARYRLEPEFIPNGLPSPQRIPLGSAATEFGVTTGEYILFASRLVPEKGCHDLIDVFNELVTTKKLIVAGGGGGAGYVGTLRAAANPGKTIFTGHLEGEKLAALFSNAYLFVLPSYIEGLSNALLEAVAYGRAIIASDLAENREVAADAAAFFPPGDRSALKRTLRQLLDNVDQIRTFEQATLRKIPTLLDWDRVAASYADLYARASPTTGAPPLGKRPSV